MSPGAWLTPASQPASYHWQAVLVPNDTDGPRAQFEAIMRGALFLTTLGENWEETTGGLTADETTEIFDRVLGSFLRGYPMLPAGTIQAYAGGPLAPAGWLKCEGQEIDQTDYPDLYAAIGSIYGTAAAGWFRLPDLRSRVIVGEGPGPGLTERELSDTGGEETHVLTGDESPSHIHHTLTHTHAPLMAQLGAGDPVPSPAIDGQADSDGFGGNQAHNNMPPFLVLHWIIFTGSFPL